MVIHIFIFMQTLLSCRHYNDNKWELIPMWEHCHSIVLLVLRDYVLTA